MEFSCMDSMPIFLCMDLHFVGTVHTNFHAKSGVCSSKNGRVIALGTKEDISGGRWRWRRRSTFSSVDNTVQTLKFVVRKFGQKLSCDYDSEAGKHYSEIESEEETVTEKTTPYKPSTSYASDLQSSRSYTSESSSEESTNSSTIRKKKPRKSSVKKLEASNKETKADMEKMKNIVEFLKEKFDSKESDMKRVKEFFENRIGVIEDRLESEKNDKKKLEKTFEEKIR